MRAISSNSMRASEELLVKQNAVPYWGEQVASGSDQRMNWCGNGSLRKAIALFPSATIACRVRVAHRTHGHSMLGLMGQRRSIPRAFITKKDSSRSS